MIRTLDAANSRLETTMDTLRCTMVEAAFRPAEEEPRSLLDFVDEEGVETMRDALKESIKESKVRNYLSSQAFHVYLNLAASNPSPGIPSRFRPFYSCLRR